MNHREYLIEDHTWAYNHNRDLIKKYWNERHTFKCSFTGKNMVREFITAAKHHKHMIEQLKELPDIVEINRMDLLSNLLNVMAK